MSRRAPAATTAGFSGGGGKKETRKPTKKLKSKKSGPCVSSTQPSHDTSQPVPAGPRSFERQEEASVKEREQSWDRACCG